MGWVSPLQGPAPTSNSCTRDRAQTFTGSHCLAPWPSAPMISHFDPTPLLTSQCPLPIGLFTSLFLSFFFLRTVFHDSIGSLECAEQVVNIPHFLINDVAARPIPSFGTTLSLIAASCQSVTVNAETQGLHVFQTRT